MVRPSDRVERLRALAREGGIYDPVLVTRLDLCALFEAYDNLLVELEKEREEHDALREELREELDRQSP